MIYTSSYKNFNSELLKNGETIEEILTKENIINDLKYKVYALKELKWAEENEWRIIVPLKETDPETLWTESKPSKPYQNFYLPKDSLTGITIFFDQSNESVTLSEYKEIENFLRERECDVPIYLSHILKI